MKTFSKTFLIVTVMTSLMGVAAMAAGTGDTSSALPCNAPASAAAKPADSAPATDKVAPPVTAEPATK